MGLLTDPSAGQGKLIKLLLKYYAKLCVLLYTVGIVYFCALASSQINSSTYFSENALLPGLVRSEFMDNTMAMNYFDELKHEMKKYDDSIPYPWLLAKFRQLGLDTYTHNFSLNYPLGASQKFTGKNVYAIIRAPRAASTEALVLSVPYRPPVSVHAPTASSIAIMLAFAKFAVKEKYWAKDIIFLVTEHEQLGMQAWLEAYHGVTCGKKDVLISGDMKGRAGSIQAAINLEIHEPEIGQIDIKIEGLNGQLPNLDLFNLSGKMALKEGLSLTFKNRLAKRLKSLWRDWIYAFQTMMSMVVTQATGVPNGNHGLFYRFGIQAVTLEGFSLPNPKSNRAGFYTIARILEGTFRSLNNLLERFHQSFFFYLLSATDRYISIGLYIPAICLLAATFMIKAYAKWCQLHNNNKTDEKQAGGDAKNQLSDDVVKELEMKHAALTQGDWEQKFEVESEKPPNDKHVGLGHVSLVYVLSHVVGFALRDLPKYMSHVGATYGYSTETSIYGTFAAVSLLGVLFPLCIRRKPAYKSMSFLNIIALLEVGTALICLAMYNISIAMFLAAIYAPATLLINPTRCGSCRIVQRVLWLMMHPFVVFNVCIAVFTFTAFPNDSLEEVFYRALGASRQAMVYSIVDSEIYGNWLYNMITMIFVSTWLCFYYVTFGKADPSEQIIKKKSD
ncbi:PREDICTED: glycosylphosphatidylinositol anchor attachment 1 protein [Nicrophorus vespilloides]|uniref:Glycosylphosphatidylinositol anchor attachment 1 protein n=1 Tax=Nicrophorus vespilloides TaxID=110193 RepID=A0ABM1MPL1_NICVS|nr:PREDICTED: glycosylphosphatidylinositol anchor attachment 1 protein [Nicrophorus vespilloides]